MTPAAQVHAWGLLLIVTLLVRWHPSCADLPHTCAQLLPFR